MTLGEFKNLKVGEEIVFGNGNVGKIISYVYKKPNIFSNMSGYNISLNDKNITITFSDDSNYITLYQDGTNVCCPFESFKLSLPHKSEKEQIEEQIKTLQDKLKEIETNDVKAIAKTLEDGDFIEIVWHDGRSVIHKVFGITDTQIGHYNNLHVDTKSDWYIPFKEISKLFIRKDIKEAYEKFSAALNLKSTY